MIAIKTRQSIKHIIQAGVFIITVLFISNGAFALTGREIMAKNNALPKAKSMITKSKLKIYKGSRIEEKIFSGISKKYGNEIRARVTFSYPTHIEFLMWDVPGEDSVQWLKMSTGKVRKIASSNKGNTWVNSHFYYEDVGDNDIDDFAYKYLGETDVSDSKGNKTSCYKVEARKVKGTRVYTKTIIYLGQKDYVIRRIDYYEKGRHTKSQYSYKIQKISGIYTPRAVVMKRTDGKGKSILFIKSIKYNAPVSDQMLKRESF